MIIMLVGEGAVVLLVIELVVWLFVIFLHVVHEPGDPVLFFHGQ